MRRLEEKENRENEENIETTYKKSPDKVIVSSSETPEESHFEDEVPKSLLSSKDNFRENSQTQF